MGMKTYSQGAGDAGLRRDASGLSLSSRHTHFEIDLVETVETADPSTPLRSGRDDTSWRANFRLGALEGIS